MSRAGNCTQCGRLFTEFGCHDYPDDPEYIIHFDGDQSVNEYGTPITLMTCAHCGRYYSVTPAVDPAIWGDGCLGDFCPSYDISRDVDMFFDPLMEHGLIKVVEND